MLRVLILDYKVLLTHTADLTSELMHTLNALKAQDVKIVVFSTDPCDIAEDCRVRGFPIPDLHIRRQDIEMQKNRGSPAWVDAVTSAFRVERHEIFYVGSTAMDWRTAINSGVFYAHAHWTGPQPAGTTCVVADAPGGVAEIATHFLLVRPRWAYSYDDPAGRFAVRSLLPASATLPADNGRLFDLKTIFTYKQDVQIGDSSAKSILGMHVLSSCYLEGLLSPGTFFCVYPGSRVGTLSQPVESFVKPASALVHGFYKTDILVRTSNAIDTSLERYKARSEGRLANVSIATQANSVCLGQNQRYKLQNRPIVVFDDFTTTGMSLDWARNLLFAAGARKVVLVTVGKYSKAYTEYTPDHAIDITGQAVIDSSNFLSSTHQMKYDEDAVDLVKDSLQRLSNQ